MYRHRNVCVPAGTPLRENWIHAPAELPEAKKTADPLPPRPFATAHWMADWIVALGAPPPQLLFSTSARLAA